MTYQVMAVAKQSKPVGPNLITGAKLKGPAGEAWYDIVLPKGSTVELPSRGQAIDCEVEATQDGWNDKILSFTVAGGAPAADAPATKAAPARKTDDYVVGVIKGNTVTNAVHIATAGGEVTLDSLKAAADLVLQLHGHLENEVDIKGYLS